MSYQCGHMEEAGPAPVGPLSQPHFVLIAVIVLKRHVVGTQLMATPSACAVPALRSGGMRSGWQLCRARPCHLTWVEGENAAKQILILLPPHATHVTVRESFLPGQRLWPEQEPWPLKAQVSLIPTLPPAAVWLLMPAAPLCASVSLCTSDSLIAPKSNTRDRQAHFSQNLPQATHPALLTPQVSSQTPGWVTSGAHSQPLWTT